MRIHTYLRPNISSSMLLSKQKILISLSIFEYFPNILLCNLEGSSHIVVFDKQGLIKHS